MLNNSAEDNCLRYRKHDHLDGIPHRIEDTCFYCLEIFQEKFALWFLSTPLVIQFCQNFYEFIQWTTEFLKTVTQSGGAEPSSLTIMVMLLSLNSLWLQFLFFHDEIHHCRLEFKRKIIFISSLVQELTEIFWIFSLSLLPVYYRVGLKKLW